MSAAEESRIDRAFAEFHAANPHVYAKLVELARQARRAGRDRIGIKALFERLRWHYHVETNDPNFKLNNNYTSRYARAIMAAELDLAEMFELRELISAAKEAA